MNLPLNKPIINKDQISKIVQTCCYWCETGKKKEAKKKLLKNLDLLMTSVCLAIALWRMGRLRFELRTSRLKAGCSTTELATLA